MEIPSGYSFGYQQLNQVTWLAKVTTPDNLIFTINVQSQGQPDNNKIFEHLINRQTRGNFILDLEENKDYWIIKDEIKPEIAPEVKLEIQPSGNV